jgi:hypothetical protein
LCWMCLKMTSNGRLGMDGREANKLLMHWRN